MPTMETCTDECISPTILIEDPVDEHSCDELEYEDGESCVTKEECGREDTQDPETGRWISEITYCAPRCPNKLDIWNSEL